MNDVVVQIWWDRFVIHFRTGRLVGSYCTIRSKKLEGSLPAHHAFDIMHLTSLALLIKLTVSSASMACSSELSGKLILFYNIFQ